MGGAGRLKELGSAVLERARPHLPSGRLVVALSGGADSAVCAWVALQTTSEVRGVHVDHQLPASPLMAKAAREVATRLELPLLEVPVSVPGGPSPEDQARRARYRALEEVLEQDESLLLGHTADDQAETVLGNFLRGAGTEGMAGMPVRRGRLVRPLLEVWRAETRELATLLRLPWRDDPANLAAEPRRNALRRELLPLLEERFNPALRKVLVRSARLAARDEEQLAGWAEAVPLRVAEEGLVSLPAPLLEVLPEPVAARAVRRALRRARGPHAGTADEVEAVLDVARGGRGRATLAGPLQVGREGSWVVLDPGTPGPEPPPVDLPLPGEAVFGRFRIEAWIEGTPPLAWPLSAWSAVFDGEVVGASARVRPAAAGGRIAFKGGHKQVADALAESGVPARLRPGWPVVEVDDRVLWIPGVRSAPWGWVGPSTTRYLWVSAEAP